MEILFMVFMVVVSIMAMFAVMVVFRDIVREILQARREERENKKAAAQQPAAQPVETVVAPVEEPAAPVEQTPVEPVVEAEPVEEPVEEAAVEEPVAEEVAAEEAVAEEVEDPEGTITFSAGQRQTLEEKYLELSSEARGWYDEIIKYATMVDGSKRFKNARYEEYKVGKNRLVRVLIKRGIIHCEFMLPNSDFKNYINENKISVKLAATTLRVESVASVVAVKSSIDIAVSAIAEEKEYKKKQAKEKRKAAKAAAESVENAK